MGINMDERSMVRNLCNWDIYFNLVNTIGDIMIKANATRELLNGEIVSQINNNNIFFVGTDGLGSHARIYIENPELRQYVGFETEDSKRKQDIITDEKCDYILNLKTQKSFEDNVKKSIITEHEKDKIMNYARKIKFNDFEKINYLEVYTSRKYK